MGNISSKHALPFEYINTQSLEKTSFANFFEVSLTRRQAKIVAVSNEQFGEAKNLLKADSVNTQTIQSEGTIDGWQVRRHLSQAIVHIRLCGSCYIKGVDIDTTGYTGGTAALFICLDGLTWLDEKRTWINLIPLIEIDENMHNFFAIHRDDIYDILRLTVLPGGGISRFRVYGQVIPTPISDGVDRNMACGGLGAQVIECNNGLHCTADILFDGDETEKSGWLTPRSRGSARNDTVTIKLAAISIINRIIVNTKPFVDKAPDAISLDVCFSQEDDPMQYNNVVWYNVVKQEKIIPNTKQTILCPHHLPVSHVRLTLLPDGGIQQIKVIGHAYYGCHNDISDENAIDTSPSNLALNTVEPLQLKGNVSISETKIQKNTLVKLEEPAVCNNITMHESRMDAENTVEFSVVSPVRKEEEEPQINKDMEAVTDTDAISQSPIMNTNSQATKEIPTSEEIGITEADEITVSDDSQSSEITHLSNVDQESKKTQVALDDSSTLLEYALLLKEGPTIKEIPHIHNNELVTENIDLSNKQLENQSILTTVVGSITKKSQLGENHPSSVEEVEVKKSPEERERNPLEEVLISRDNKTTATDSVANLNREVPTENNQGEALDKANSSLTNFFIINDSLQCKYDLEYKKSKQENVEGIGLLSKSTESNDMVAQNNVQNKEIQDTPNKYTTLALTILQKDVLSEDSEKPTIHQVIPEGISKQSHCYFSEMSRISNNQGTSTVSKEDQSVHACFEGSSPSMYKTPHQQPFSPANESFIFYSPPSFPLVVHKNGLNKQVSQHDSIKKKQDPASVETKEESTSNPPPIRRSPRTHATNKFAKPKRIPTILVESSNSTDDDDSDEEFENRLNRTFTKSIGIPTKRQRAT